MGARDTMKIILSFFTLLLSACMNPMKSIEPQKAEFNTHYKDNFINYTSHGRTLRAAWSGDATKPPLLFVHGSPGSFDAWADFLINKDLQAHYHILAVDRPGYGGSEAGNTELSLQNQSDEIFDALQLNHSGQKAIVIGHSFGGPVVARMMMDHPDKIIGGVFVAGSFDPSYEDSKWYQYVADSKLVSWMVPKFLRVCNEEIMAMKPQLTEMLPMWANLKPYVVILQGDKDDLVDPGNFKFLAEKINPSLVVKSTMLPGMDHFIPWKRADLIYEGISLLSAKASQ